MASSKLGGYAGRILRVDLTNGRIDEDKHDEPTLRRWVGGTGIGAKYLYDLVAPGVEWNDPRNMLSIASGPLGGTRLGGTGTISVVTKGPLTNTATSTQANGFMGAFMKFAGFDGVVFTGASEKWAYLYMHDGVAELRDASHLVGKDTWEMQEAIAAELGKKEADISVMGVGPAGEHLVRFAAVAGDHGHVAGHNGSGAAMGAKKVKAIVATRSSAKRPHIHDAARLAALNAEIAETIKNDPSLRTFEWGTSMGIAGAAKGGWLPIKNYTTSIFKSAGPFMGECYRAQWEIKRSPCWACPTKHLHMIKVTDGPYAGYVGEEPEYEQWAAWGPQIGNTDVAAAFVLSNEVDRLGVDTNEAGWVIGFVMECYDKGVLTKADCDGLEMTWGNAEAARAMLRKIANREGIGDLLAEGVKRAAEKLGGDAVKLGVYTMKGASPRGHDHRSRWTEMFDTSTSNVGTMESGPNTYPAEVGAPTKPGLFSPEDTVMVNVKMKGRMIFEDSLGICRFMSRVSLGKICEAVNAVTGWDYDVPEAMDMGRRVVHMLRVFNLRHGMDTGTERPGPRYGSTPIDGPAMGKTIAPHWDNMLKLYYEQMGWDATGRPLPETLRQIGLESIIPDLEAVK